jgi:DNA anti-recombination protein RmuC
MEPIILVVLGLQLLGTIAALIWVAVLQNKVVQRDDDVDAAARELEALRQQGRNLTMARILLETQDTFGTDIKAAVAQITAEFKRDLNNTLAGVGQQSDAEVKAITAAHQQTLTQLRDTAAQQMDAATKQLVADFQQTLAAIRTAAEKPIEQMSTMVDEQRQGFNARVEEEVKKHEARLIAKFDAKVSDVVSNYLTETLGNDVDLGAQGPYLFRMLEEHKAEIKQEIANGA